MPLSQRIHLGYSLDAPCLLCVAGACQGGARVGLSSSVDASDATYGDVSYDCPPSPIYTISGGGLKTLVDYTTGGVSLPFGTACDWPLGAFDCAVASAGTCGGGGASTRYPNSCSDGACIDVGGGEGECATHFDTFCDGFVSSSGKGIVVCFDNSDCLAIGPSCPGGDCGNCALVQAHECFLDPIAATGSPGAFRVKQNLDSSEVLCSDGVTQFFPPGGSNCP